MTMNRINSIVFICIFTLVLSTISFGQFDKQRALDFTIKASTVVLGTALVIKYAPGLINDAKALINKKIKI